MTRLQSLAAIASIASMAMAAYMFFEMRSGGSSAPDAGGVTGAASAPAPDGRVSLMNNQRATVAGLDLYHEVASDGGFVGNETCRLSVDGDVLEIAPGATRSWRGGGRQCAITAEGLVASGGDPTAGCRYRVSCR